MTKDSVIITILLLVCSLSMSAQFNGDQCLIKSEFISLLEDVPFPSCHASTIVQSGDGLVHITYTWNRKIIKHVVIDPSKIITRSFKGDEWPEK